MSNSGSSNKYNDPTLPGYDPSRPAGTAAQSTSKPSSQPSSSSSINRYNDPTLPGYDPSRPTGTAAQSTSKPSSQPSSSSSINRYNDPTLPGYDPSRPTGSEQYEQVAEKPRYTPPPRSSLPPHLRGYFPAPKL